MRQILRVALMVLLAAVLGVGSARGDGEEYTDGNGVTWKCYETAVRGTRCIGIPERNRGSISGFVKIPETVVVNGVSLTVVELGADAFKDCIGLTGVTIPGSVTKIGWGTFSGCSGLKEVTIPSSVARIGVDAFRSCIGLTAVTIPGSVTKIGDFAFCGCSGLTSVTISDGVTEIGESAFLNCSGLTAVTIPGRVTEIGEDAFGGCSGLTAVTISEGVTKIGDGAFFGCSGLTAMTIPGRVTEIGRLVFSGCSGLNAVYWLADANCTVEDEAFGWIAYPATLYVRKGEKAAIEANEQTWWKKFDKIEEGYVVTFQDGEGHTLGKQLVAMDSAATVPTAPTKEGYIVEWQLDGAKYDFSTAVTKDITLVAVWKQSYTVTFDAKGGTPAPDAQTVVKDGTATAPTAAPAKEGYTFVEWQLDGKKYDFSKPVTQNITLVAKWKKKEKSTPSTPNNPETAVESVQLAGVRVLRNPVGEALELEGMERAARVEVYSVVGARVHAEALRGEPRVVIDAQGWASGVYVVRVEASDGEKTLRVVK